MFKKSLKLSIGVFLFRYIKPQPHYFLLLLGFIFYNDCCIASELENNKNPTSSTEQQVFLLSSPRSGTNLVIGILQSLYCKPIVGEGTELAHNRLNLNLSQEKPIVFRTHYPGRLQNVNQKKNKLLFVLRNFLECIHLREKEFLNRVLNKELLKSYIYRLDFYDKWSGKKLLIYYEDLITDTEKTIYQLINFFDEELKIEPREFLKNLDDFKEKIYISYHNQHNYPRKSDGKSIISNSKDFSRNTVETINIYIKESYPELWDKYLKRYYCY